MKNKNVMITLAVIASFVSGMLVGHYIPDNLISSKSSNTEQPHDYPDSVINRVLDEPNFCNKTVVENSIRKYFNFYFPNTQIIENTMAIQDMGDCIYHIRFRVRTGYVRKTVILQYTYDYTFSKYFVKTLKESNY